MVYDSVDLVDSVDSCSLCQAYPCDMWHIADANIEGHADCVNVMEHAISV